MIQCLGMKMLILAYYIIFYYSRRSRAAHKLNVMHLFELRGFLPFSIAIAVLFWGAIAVWQGGRSQGDKLRGDRSG
jgi:hypothetical protein